MLVAKGNRLRAGMHLADSRNPRLKLTDEQREDLYWKSIEAGERATAAEVLAVGF